ncbi:hypothetical protein H0H81_006192 [Sphagnurus paluster]|uniref:Uncharacterized protein n=1 Tax=Sphagnurus paluster TaxID=117069 RepID=A0A9P7K3P9_9AGAR|nr:hypothetical protein H0H81_006192 [Sphagnurus paluster]
MGIDIKKTISSWFSSTSDSDSETTSTTSSSLSTSSVTFHITGSDPPTTPEPTTPTADEHTKAGSDYDYGYGLSRTSFAELVSTEYPSLHSSELVHLDHAAAPPSPISAISALSSVLTTTLYSNPHSHPSTQREVDIMRGRVMCTLFGLGQRELERWDLVWTAGTTASLEIIAEHFPWSNATRYRYLKESHTSLVGIRGCALVAGAAVESLDLDAFLISQQVEGCVLHAYPAQCNVTGSRLGLGPAIALARQGRDRKQAILVDAAAYLSTSPLDLSLVSYEEAPDFVVGSFYKIYVRLPHYFIEKPSY